MISAAAARSRLAAQLLTDRSGRDVAGVVRRLLAVQAQDVRGMRLALRSRSRGLHAADLDRALTVDRSLVVSWLNRGTLHLVAAEDYGWLQQLTTPPLHTANARRLAQEGVDAGAGDRGVEVIARALADGPLRRADLRVRLDAAGVPTAGQALVHLLMAASLRGLVLRGPVVDGEQAFVLARDWLGGPEVLPRERALAELARRYLAGHAPAGDRDLARWAGLPLRDARAGLAGLGGEVRERPDGLLEPAAAPSDPAGVPEPVLLGPFDPALLGWADRRWILGDHEPRLVSSNGVFRPVLLAGGRTVGTWGLAGGRLSTAPFGALSAPQEAALSTDAADVRRFLGAAG